MGGELGERRKTERCEDTYVAAHPSLAPPLPPPPAWERRWLDREHPLHSLCDLVHVALLLQLGRDLVALVARAAVGLDLLHHRDLRCHGPHPCGTYRAPCEGKHLEKAAENRNFINCGFG